MLTTPEIERHTHNPLVRYLRLLGPGLPLLVMLVSNNRSMMGVRTNGPWLNALGWTATAVMTAAAVAFFATSQ